MTNVMNSYIRSDLSTFYPEQMLFKSILSGIPFQTQTSIDRQLSENIMQRLRASKSNDEQMAFVLNDLDRITDSKPEILDYFVVKNRTILV